MQEHDYLTSALEWAEENKPDTSLEHKMAFANCVLYLCTGHTGGYGGPSLREHLVSYSLFLNSPLPPPGEWTVEEAIRYCAPYCFDSAQKFLSILARISEQEYCFDDDPQDLEVLLGK